MEKLTPKKALEQGYTHYGFHGREWQTAHELHENIFEEVEEEEWPDLVLFSKDYLQQKYSEKEVSERMSDWIGDEYGEAVQRDDDEVYKAIAGIDFSDITNKINEQLENYKYWMLTDISLIPELENDKT